MRSLSGLMTIAFVAVLVFTASVGWSEETGAVCGTIVDESGAPKEDWAVKLFSGQSARDRSQTAETKTNGSGVFTFNELPSGWFKLEFEERPAPAESIKPDPNLDKTTLAALEQARQQFFREAIDNPGRFWVAPGAKLDLGRLTLKKRGCLVRATAMRWRGSEYDPQWAPLCGVSISAWSPPQTIVVPAQITSADGQKMFELPSAATGDEIAFFDVGHWQGPKGGGTGILAIDPPVREKIDEVWCLREVVVRAYQDCTFIEGTVKDEQGKAVAGAHVLLTVPQVSSWTMFPSLTTGPDGKFRFEPLDRGQYEVCVQRNGYPVHRELINLVSRGNVMLVPGRTLEVILSRKGCGTVEGTIDFSIGSIRFVDFMAHGARVSGKEKTLEFGIYLVPTEETDPRPFVPRFLGEVGSTPGSYRIEGVAAGAYRVLFAAVSDQGPCTNRVGPPSEDQCIPLPERYWPAPEEGPMFWARRI
ncbi:MAG: carboxypeptidase-like regulatory domain-containing protein, partial [Planctomycetota bacterium]|nr:carboxypeptidase-like regulatory domain-containing protein [Planctomycetota bacterium]